MARPSRVSTPTTKAFAERLSDLVQIKKSEGLSHDEISRQIGVSSGVLSEWMSDNKTASIENLAKLSKYFGVSADYLLGLSDVQTADVDVRAVCENVGLSETTCDWLFTLYLEPSIQESVLKGLNTLLECDEFENLCLSINEMAEAIKILPDNSKWEPADRRKIIDYIYSENENVESNTMGLYRIINKWESVYFYKATIKEQFSDISDSIYKDELSKKPKEIKFI